MEDSVMKEIGNLNILLYMRIGGLKGRSNLWNLSQGVLIQMNRLIHQHHLPWSLQCEHLLQEKLMMSPLIYRYNEKSMKSLMMMTSRKHKGNENSMTGKKGMAF